MFLASQLGWLVGAHFAIQKEAARRAGGSAGVDAWRASKAWSASEFRLDHDYDPQGSAFQALLAMTEERGYSLVGSGMGGSHGAMWHFRRALE
jgi:hypothetical protein